jgi:hypothetical protein
VVVSDLKRLSEAMDKGQASVDEYWRKKKMEEVTKVYKSADLDKLLKEKEELEAKIKVALHSSKGEAAKKIDALLEDAESNIKMAIQIADLYGLVFNWNRDRSTYYGKGNEWSKHQSEWWSSTQECKDD